MTLHPLIEPGWVNAILPELILTGGGILLMLVAAFAPRLRQATAPLALIVFIAAAWSENLVRAGRFFGGTYEVSGITRIFDITFLLAAMLATLFAREYLERENIESGEFYALLMWATVGMMMMAKGLDLLIVILGLELLSICIFVLVGYHRRIPISNEASLKYFLMGAFATGFILYGTALFYGSTRSTNFAEMSRVFATANPSDPMLTIAFVLLMSGFGFKLAVAPFHGWAPDVYQGAPTPVAGWLSVAPKAATLIAVIRLLAAMSPLLQHAVWLKMIAALSILSMVIGNAVAIAQRDLKRMLAYSGIAHAGYILLGVLPGTTRGFTATLFYIAAYAVMNFGAFAVVTAVGAGGEQTAELSYWRGLFYRRPFLATVMTIFMLSLAGIPPTVGFFAKLFVFQALVTAQIWAPLVVAVIMTVVSFYYYLRVIVVMLAQPDGAVAEKHIGFSTSTVLGAAAVATIFFGLFPSVVLDWAGHAASLHF